jgi:hypothetical protein
MSLVVGIGWAGEGEFGEINLKFGYDFEGDVRGNVVFDMDTGIMDGGPASGTAAEYRVTETRPAGSGISAGAEYLYAVPFGSSSGFLYSGFLKAGAGAQYLFSRKGYGSGLAAGETESGTTKFSHIPIYAILQLNPAKSLPGLFCRGVAGYSLFLEWDQGDNSSWGDEKGGLHWGLSAGYETDWGFFIEYVFAQTHFSREIQGFDAETNFVYSKSGLAIGYKKNYSPRFQPPCNRRQPL